jgi:hypothetical protein
VTITLSRVKQDTQIRSSTIIDYEIYFITNPDNKCGGREFMVINNLISMNMHHKLLHAILSQNDLFSNKREPVSNTQNLYKCLTWTIYNLYIKYTFFRVDNFPCYQFYLGMAILPMGTGTRGYRTSMGRVWAYFYTHGYYLYPTYLVMGRARV